MFDDPDAHRHTLSPVDTATAKPQHVVGSCPGWAVTKIIAGHAVDPYRIGCP